MSRYIVRKRNFALMLFYKQLLVITTMQDEKNELIYLGIMTVLMIAANVFLRLTPLEQLQQFALYVTPTTIFIFLVHFFVRGHILRQKFSKYLVHAPIKPHHYKKNYTVKAVNSTVFFATELFSIFVLAMTVFIIGFGMGGDNFEKIHIWETLASFGVFPFLGQIMPILLKWDE